MAGEEEEEGMYVVLVKHVIIIQSIIFAENCSILYWID